MLEFKFELLLLQFEFEILSQFEFGFLFPVACSGRWGGKGGRQFLFEFKFLLLFLCSGTTGGGAEQSRKKKGKEGIQ